MSTTLPSPTFTSTPPREIPADRYRSVEWDALERERLWPGVWQIACTVDCVPEAGDWYEYEIAGRSVVVVRGGDGVIRAFQNACRHRGNALLEGSGTGLAEIRCPYHHWCYDLHGDLARVTADGTGVGRPGPLSLVPVAVDIWGGLVFVHPDPDPEPFTDFLEVLPDELGWVGMADYTCRYALSVPMACNWKVVIDAFIETYHLHAVHPQMLPIADDVHTPIRLFGRHTMFEQPYGVPSPRLDGTATDDEVWQEYVRNLGHRLGRTFAAGDDPGPPPAVPEGGTMRDALVGLIRDHHRETGAPYADLDDERIINDYHYHVFPNTVFNVFAGWYGFIRARPGDTPGTCILDMWNFDLLPEGHPDRHCRPVHSTLTPEECVVLGQVMMQDIVNLPRTQKGLSQPGLRTVRLLGAEARIGRMHQVLDHYMGTDLEAEVRATR